MWPSLLTSLAKDMLSRGQSYSRTWTALGAALALGFILPFPAVRRIQGEQLHCDDNAKDLFGKRSEEGDSHGAVSS